MEKPNSSYMFFLLQPFKTVKPVDGNPPWLHNICPACVRPWVPTPAPQKNKHISSKNMGWSLALGLHKHTCPAVSQPGCDSPYLWPNIPGFPLAEVSHTA